MNERTKRPRAARHAFWRAALLCSTWLIALIIAAPAHAQTTPDSTAPFAEKLPDNVRLVGPSHERFALRVGLYGQMLFGAEDTYLFRYADMGFRYKAGEYHIDVRIPGLMVLPDLLAMMTREQFTGQFETPFLESINEDNPDIFQAWEILHARLGYRFQVQPRTRDERTPRPVDIAIGLYGGVEMLFFEIRKDVNQERMREFGYDDPLMVVGGFFVSAGRSMEKVQFDVALALGTAVRGEEVNPDRSVLTAALDLDLLIELGYGVGVYLRPRLHAYLTDLDPALNISAALSSGLNISF
ncbi:hypothetical protein FRC98_12690 [Lujinxingia vulgaris]|uniref:Outer membrane protein beta-barrel domain-containing protein n=1 Tax=Lujinxingia vulgaris TaxID=2600176 RepID=A0A5C6X673_9DELT|nr:hypothetical protein [Lujinxingia vulgaris]TXD36680.1 hypothetical protein FRC98_12690 [Lujinxingia vulgaris]